LAPSAGGRALCTVNWDAFPPFYAIGHGPQVLGNVMLELDLQRDVIAPNVGNHGRNPARPILPEIPKLARPPEHLVFHAREFDQLVRRNLKSLSRDLRMLSADLIVSNVSGASA
jgi:hypothetical protein